MMHLNFTCCKWCECPSKTVSRVATSLSDEQADDSAIYSDEEDDDCNGKLTECWIMKDEDVW